MTAIEFQLQEWASGVFADRESRQKGVAAAVALLTELAEGARQQTGDPFSLRVTRSEGRPTSVSLETKIKVA